MLYNIKLLQFLQIFSYTSITHIPHTENPANKNFVFYYLLLSSVNHSSLIKLTADLMDLLTNSSTQQWCVQESLVMMILVTHGKEVVVSVAGCCGDSLRW